MANQVDAKLVVQILANNAGLINGLKQSQVSISNFEKRIVGIQRSLGSLGLAFGAFQIGAVILDSIRRVADFEKQMDTVAAIAGATGKEFESLRNDALRLGAATQFTATEVAKLQTEFGRLGFTTDEILAATEATVDLSVATGEDLAKSADVAGSTVRAFGLSAEEALRVVDVMAESFNKTALSLDNFTESMKYVAPIARAANISVEETTALLGVLSDAGIRGSQAGTGLRRIITDLAKDGRPLQERLKELAAQGLDLGGAMDEVGRFAQTALLVLTSNTDKIEQLTDSFQNAGGAAKETAAIMRDNLSGDIERLTSAWDGFILSLDKSDGSLRRTIQSLTELVNLLTSISNSRVGDFITPDVTIDLVESFGVLGERMRITRSEAELIFNELSRLKTIAILEGDDKRASELSRQLEILTTRFNDLGVAVGFVGPLVQKVIDPRILKGLAENGNETVGIIEALESRAKDLGEAIKKATSIEGIRALQHELEGVKLRIDAILNPSVPPKPVKMTIEVDTESSKQEFIDSVLNISNELSALNPDGFVIPVSIEIDRESTEEFDAYVETLRATTIDIGGLLSSAVSSFAQAIGEAAVGVGDFGSNILKAVAGFAKQYGEILIAAGIATLAAKQLIKNPVGAIVGGAALVAIASAVNASLSSTAANTFGGGAGSLGARQSQVRDPFQTERAGEQIVLVGGEFRVRGNDLVLALDKTNKVKQKTG